MHRSLATRVLGVALTLVALVLFVAGCSRVINRTAERKIREALPDAIGPARQYRVHIENAPLRTVEGKLANVTIDGEDVRFPTGVLLDSLHIDLKNVNVDTDRGRVRHIEDARFTIIVSEKSLDEYIAGEAPRGESIRKTRLTLGDHNYITVTGERVTLLNVGIPFSLTGPIRVVSPTRVEIDTRRLDVAGIPFSGRVLSFFKSRIESSLDLHQFPVPVQLSSVTTQRGRIILSGSIDAEALLSRAQAAR